MDQVPVRIEIVKRTVQHVMDQPVDAKHWPFLFARFHADFVSRKGREPQYDNDWWVEGDGERIAICYTLSEAREMP